ncbi:peptide-binding protein [bacterium]|nr:peptide-binding protein [bacterium]
MLKKIEILSVVFLGLFLFGCTQRERERKIKFEDKPCYGDMIINASIGDASYLNPVLSTDSSSGTINDLVYNGLVKYDKDLNLVGDLAKSWTVSQDRLVITFYLHQNVKWHDGVSFTADDVKFTYNKLIDPEVKTPYSSKFEKVSKIEIVDKHTLKVTYKEPFSPGLASWVMGIIPRHIFQKGDFNSHPANQHPVGTGPYIFKDWKRDEKIVLEANPEYFEGKPYINKYIYRIIPDQAVEFLELKAGNVDMVSLTPHQYRNETNSLQFQEDFNRFRYPSFGYTYLGYNLLNPLFKDKRIRQAIAYAINKEEIIQGVLLDLGKPATGPFPPSSWAYNPEIKQYPYNPDKAKKILDETGWKDTNNDGILDKDGKKFEFTITTNHGNKTRALCAEIIQANLKKIGIKINIHIIEWSSFIHQYIDKKKFEATLLGWSLSLDPDCYSIWHSSQMKEGRYNFISYKNEEVDSLLVKGRKIFDQEKRKKIYHRIHAILAEEQPYTFLYVGDSLPVVHNRFYGIKVAPLGIGYNFIKWYVPEKLHKYTRFK